MRLRAIESRLPPGFRFHPTDHELVCYYLRNKTKPPPAVSAAATMLVDVDLHECEPWELPDVAKLLCSDEWYFFSCRDRKYATGSRRNRATKQGYWKATGKDKAILQQEDGSASAVLAGTRKTLVFYFGRAPHGQKSGWIMHEFRLNNHIAAHHIHTTPDSPPNNKEVRNAGMPASIPIHTAANLINKQNNTLNQEEDWVLCRVFHKQRTNYNGEAQQLLAASACVTSNTPSSSSPPQQIDYKLDGQLLIRPPPVVPTTMSASSNNQDRIGIQLHQHNQRIILDDQQHYMIYINDDDEQPQGTQDAQQQHQYQLLDLAMFQAPSSSMDMREQAPAPAGGGFSSMDIITEMESMIATSSSCGALQADANYEYYMPLY
ncbi:hypothetical protein GUJ93_ZPchr0006g46404 [Zizania palustris]|uniref:NAC domain-containing protein n=1 Tax=Zizania palustris TaxID=103762 RepID=A0A8J5W2E6_ZIZPA|nr:hypothetical protein GUJ93_ZPchr0006g46404 [Zizania palustris]